MSNDLHNSFGGVSHGRERLFTAIRLPSKLQEFLRLEAEWAQTRLDFRKWTDHRDYHITLQFLGDTPSAEIGKLKKVLREASLAFQPFSLNISDWGTFGLERAPKVLWKGVSGDVERLHSLQKHIVESTAQLGFQAELRPYRPHITMARKFVGQVPEHTQNGIFDLPPGHSSPVNSWTVDGFVLYVTRLGQIPMYEVVDTFSFSCK